MLILSDFSLSGPMQHITVTVESINPNNIFTFLISATIFSLRLLLCISFGLYSLRKVVNFFKTCKSFILVELLDFIVVETQIMVYHSNVVQFLFHEISSNNSSINRINQRRWPQWQNFSKVYIFCVWLLILLNHCSCCFLLWDWSWWCGASSCQALNFGVIKRVLRMTKKNLLLCTRKYVHLDKIQNVDKNKITNDLHGFFPPWHSSIYFMAADSFNSSVRMSPKSWQKWRYELINTLLWEFFVPGRSCQPRFDCTLITMVWILKVSFCWKYQ